MTSWKVFVAQLLTIIAGKSQTRKWALDKGVGLCVIQSSTSLHVQHLGKSYHQWLVDPAGTIALGATQSIFKPFAGI